MAFNLALLSVPGTASGPLIAAVAWIEGVLLGPVATTMATIAIAWLGIAMLTGRTDWRRGLTVVLGCFILFGAPVIGRALAGLTSTGVGAAPDLTQSEPTPPPALPQMPPAVDPYAGAAVPGN